MTGSYTFNIIEAEQNLVSNFDLLYNAREELDPHFDIFEQGAEAANILICCYLFTTSNWWSCWWTT